jgi:c(7)-type cytochrome triheme protein
MSRARSMLCSRGAIAALALCAIAMRPPDPHTYGRVVLDTFTARAGVPPVAFDHWRHRAAFTCRVCHVDVGFAMTAGATQVSAATNRAGFHCGACHDGKHEFAGKTLFASCSPYGKASESPACTRCHTRDDPARLRQEYEAFTAKLPRDALGGVDWEKAEASWAVRPRDFLEGVSIPRKPLENKREIAIASKATWMTDVLFSHPKHAVWMGCEVCHPEIFPSTRGGQVRYSMLQINNGEACGVCHTKVAFPIADCKRCHTTPVQPRSPAGSTSSPWGR